MNALDEVRESCRFAAEAADFVRIDEQGLAGFVRRLTATGIRPRRPAAAPAVPFADDRQKVNWTCVLAQLNFGSGYRHPLARHAGQGAFQTMQKGTLRMVAEGSPLDAAALCAVDDAHVARLFGTAAPELRELTGLVARSLRTTGERLRGLQCADWYAFLQSRLAEGPSCRRLVALLVEHFPTLQDSAPYKGRRVALYKKAQVMAAELHRHFGADPRHPFLHFGDTAALTVFADNVVPAVLRVEGVLVLAPALQARIDGRQPLAPLGPEEA